MLDICIFQLPGSNCPSSLKIPSERALASHLEVNHCSITWEFNEKSQWWPTFHKFYFLCCHLINMAVMRQLKLFNDVLYSPLLPTAGLKDKLVKWILSLGNLKTFACVFVFYCMSLLVKKDTALYNSSRVLLLNLFLTWQYSTMGWCDTAWLIYNILNVF